MILAHKTLLTLTLFFSQCYLIFWNICMLYFIRTRATYGVFYIFKNGCRTHLEKQRMSYTLWFSYLVTGCSVCTVSRYSVKKIILIIYVILLNISLSVPTLNKNSFGIWKHSVFIQLKLCYYLFHVKYNNREIKHGNASS